jgi:hypothetical protein
LLLTFIRKPLLRTVAEPANALNALAVVVHHAHLLLAVEPELLHHLGNTSSVSRVTLVRLFLQPRPDVFGLDLFAVANVL